MNICRWFSTTALLVSASTCIAQEVYQVEAKSDTRKLADSLFNTGNYQQAIPVFQELHDRYSQDTYYNYALGVCILNSTNNAEIAIPYLSKASAGETPSKVYYYLAEAYRKTYRFDQAIDYYRRFTINGGSKDIKSGEVERAANLCENGNSLLKYIYSPQITDKKRVSTTDFYTYYSLVSGLGSFVNKPDDLKTSVDQKQNDNSIIFYPKNSKSGDYIYYSSYGKSTIYGRDIYRIKRLDDGYWSKPENLGEVINTPEDEDYPYMSSDGVTLFFTSKGHYSMGGYDIYRSVFDVNAKKWSTPENIGFPFSSPYDDYLYLTDENDSLACFSTNRNCDGDSVDVVMYKVDNNPIRRSFTSVEEVQGIAMLKTKKDKVVKNINVENKPQDSEKLPILVNKLKSKSASFNAVENDPEYIRVITNGFSKQKETDSLRIRLEKLRGRFDYITTAEERKSLESKVVKVENALLAAQGEADKMFARASEIEQEYLTGKRKPEGKINTSFTTDNPDYLYQAQFAPTVFRSDEINKLAQIEKLQNQINAAREEVVSAKAKYDGCVSDSTKDCKALNIEMSKKMNTYNSLIIKWVEVKYKIYSDCVLVAIVKSGNNNSDEAKAEIDRANTHFRAALAIKNNLSDEGRTESLYEASLLNELGILRLEIAFARTWGMNLFEQQATSKVIRLEKMAFGNPLVPVINKTNKEEREVKVEVKQDIGITKVEPTKIDSEPILIKKDEPITFQVVDQTPYDAQNPIPVNESYPMGVIYKIQLGAYSKPLEIPSFKGMIPVSIEWVSGAKVSKYFVGKFFKLSDAEKSLPVVRSKGFKDAFIVAWFNGKSIPLTRAQTMESNQTEEVKLKPKNQNNSDPISIIEKIYIVQIGKYSNKLPDDIYQTVKAMTSGKDIVRKFNEQGQMVYSIGNYATLEEATRIKDNLIASGISSAIVICIEIEKK